MRSAAAGVPLALVAALAVTVTAAADDNAPPVISNMAISPKRVCRKQSDTCPHPGGKVTFDITEYSQVVAATRPLNSGVGMVVLFKRKLHAGRNFQHFSVKGLPTGKYYLQLSAVDPSNNRSHPRDKNYFIVKK